MSGPSDPLLLRHLLAALHGRYCTNARSEALHRLTTSTPDDLAPLMLWLGRTDHQDLDHALRELAWEARCVVTGQQRLRDLPLWFIAALLDPGLEGL